MNSEFDVIHQNIQSRILEKKDIWQYLAITAKKEGLMASSRYMKKCSYYSVDLHLSNDGARHKLLKLPPPSTPYMSAEESHLSKEEEEANSFQSDPSLYSSLRILSKRSLLGEYGLLRN